MVPHPRHTTVKRQEIEAVPELKILASGVEDRVGVYAVSNHGGSQIFITGHPEYDGDTLRSEYLRDKAAGLAPMLPENYFPDGDDSRQPVVTWRSHANLLYSNWLNYLYIKQHLTTFNKSAKQRRLTNGKPTACKNTNFFSMTSERDRAIAGNTYRGLSSPAGKGIRSYQSVGGVHFSEDPTYITNHKNARALICRIDRDELMVLL